MNSRFMRILVFYDLPTYSKSDKRAYTEFRKLLINNGFDMVQFSIYSKIVKNHDHAKKFEKIIEANTPPRGSIRMLTVTEKQYVSMKVLVGEKTITEMTLDTKDVLEI